MHTYSPAHTYMYDFKNTLFLICFSLSIICIQLCAYLQTPTSVLRVSSHPNPNPNPNPKPSNIYRRHVHHKDPKPNPNPNKKCTRLRTNSKNPSLIPDSTAIFFLKRCMITLPLKKSTTHSQ